MPRRVKQVPLTAPFEERPDRQEVEDAMANLQIEESVGSAAATSAAATSVAATSAAATSVAATSAAATSVAATSVAATSAASASTENDYVYLTCVKIQGKLRVRITTPGYLTTANCQFPRDLRVEGRNFRVKPAVVKLMSTRNKYYYCIKNAKDIEIVQPANLPKQPPPKLKVYQDTEQEECLICYDAAKEAVFNPCGHFYTCHACSIRCKTCPVCRHPVLSVIDKNELE